MVNVPDSRVMLPAQEKTVSLRCPLCSGLMTVAVETRDATSSGQMLECPYLDCRGRQFVFQIGGPVIGLWAGGERRQSAR